MIEILSVSCGCLSIPELIIRPGLVAITGPNGSGKTTLLELIAGLVVPRKGTVLINGKEPGTIRTGWIGEFPDLNMTFTRVVDEISSSLRFAHLPYDVVNASVHAMARSFSLDSLLDRPVRSLSGGEKVLVAIAAAVINRPDILILDETDSHLDAATLGDVDNLIRAAGVPLVLFATHRPDRVAGADRVLVMKDGMILREGTPDEVYLHSSSGADSQPSLRSLRDPALWRAVLADHS